MDLWGHCTTCDRWFYCPTPDGAQPDEKGSWGCPVCGNDPTALENRSAM